MVDFVFNEDEEIFNSNVDKINSIIKNSINLKTNEILNNNEYIPPTSGGSIALSGVEKAFYERNSDLTPR